MQIPYSGEEVAYSGDCRFGRLQILEIAYPEIVDSGDCRFWRFKIPEIADLEFADSTKQILDIEEFGDCSFQICGDLISVGCGYSA